MDKFTFWKMIHEFLEYVGRFAPLIILVIVLFGFAVIYSKNHEKDEWVYMTFEEIIVFIGKMAPGISLVVVLFAYKRILERKNKWEWKKWLKK